MTKIIFKIFDSGFLKMFGFLKDTGVLCLSLTTFEEGPQVHGLILKQF